MMNVAPFEYCIDSPKPNETINSPSVLISGWIISEKEKLITNPKLYHSNTPISSLTIVKRPDVERHYPNHYVIGFSQLISILDIPSDKDLLIKFSINEKSYNFSIDFEVEKKIYEQFLISKKKKLETIKNLIQCPLCKSENISSSSENTLKCLECEAQFNVNHNSYNFLPQILIEHGNIKPTANVSSNHYDSVALDIINQNQNGLILDNGCGLRSVYYDNVVNFEIVDYPTTDVLGIGEKLPFKSEVFDAVFSLAVLEHVKNPFECAKEITRVLKPGGTLYVAVPFLQPFHGYPDHYYNMTSSGLKNLFSEEFQIVECNVPPAGLPIWCLTWFLNSYINGLPEQVAKKFKNMRVADLLDSPLNYLDKEFVTQLNPKVNDELASVNCLVAKKL
jgi:SAM-dependent methyltransferase